MPQATGVYRNDGQYSGTESSPCGVGVMLHSVTFILYSPSLQMDYFPYIGDALVALISSCENVHMAQFQFYDVIMPLKSLLHNTKLFLRKCGDNFNSMMHVYVIKMKGVMVNAGRHYSTTELNIAYHTVSHPLYLFSL